MEYHIDLTGVRSPRELHERVQAVLPCPTEMGRNLDALFDLLTERGGDWQIRFLGCRELEEILPGYTAALKRMCAAAQAEQSGLRVEFLP